MIDDGVLVALTTIGGLWFAVARCLAISLRDDPADDLDGHLSAKTSAWRPQPQNRASLSFPTGAGAANPDDRPHLVTAKDLRA